MENITVTISADSKKAHLVPFKGFMLKRGVNEQLFSDAVVKNKQSELKLWKAVAID